MMAKVSVLPDQLATHVRTHDPDRFLLALLAPAEAREALLLLAAFNHELVRALELPSARGEAGPIASPPFASLIRLQWWREVVEGEQRRHALAEPLGEALHAGWLPRALLLELIEARESEAEGFASVEAWRTGQLGGPGALQAAIGMVLGETDPTAIERLRCLGAAYASGAMLRHRSAILAAGRDPFPPGDEDGTMTRAAGLGWLAEAGRMSGPASLAGVLARRDLRRPIDTGGRRQLGDLLALVAASLRRTRNPARPR